MVVADKHGWYELHNYLFLHSLHLQRFVEEGFIVQNALSHGSSYDPRGNLIELMITGRITCQHRLFLDVEEEFEFSERSGRVWVRVNGCKYHAGILGHPPRTIFRYDTAHPYAGHPDNYHKHLFDHETWREIGTPIWIGRQQWPSLAEVIDELRAWWETTGRFQTL
ncbi:MAG: hypothetical protein KC442_00445 [Thermomicrobiales bacterium]|nr:hypothetical protein [Thermomicrobiales bacterium]